MTQYKPLDIATPVAPLCLIALDSAKGLGLQINDHLVQLRKTRENNAQNTSAYDGYCLSSYLYEASCPRFGSGEAKCALYESVRGKDVYIMVDVCNHSITYKMFGQVNRKSPDDHYQDLKRVIAALSGHAHRITVIMPFLYEGRQHARNKRESLDCAYALQELNKMGVKNVITFDAHDPRVLNATPLSGCDSFNPFHQYIDSLLSHEKDLIIDKSHTVVIGPDKGALNRAIYFANVLGVDTGTFYKRRDYTKVVDGKNPIVAHEFLGASIDGKDVIIVDDIISSGESMLNTAKKLKEMNAKRVFLCCTYGLFTKGLEKFDEAYEKCYFDRVITTNLTYLSPEIKARPYFTEADCSMYLASLIDYLNHDLSLSNAMISTEKIQESLRLYNDRKDDVAF